jgi:hypothetical protein
MTDRKWKALHGKHHDLRLIKISLRQQKRINHHWECMSCGKFFNQSIHQG